MAISPLHALNEGIEILMPFLGEHGFQHASTEERRGSGGDAAMATIVRGERSLSLHHRFGLGIVEYAINDCSATHEQYLEYLGVYTESQFLWCRMDLGLLRYKALLNDLTQFFDDFLTGDGHVIVGHSTISARQHEERAYELNAAASGETQMRQDAHALFRDGNYSRVVEILGSLRYPKLMNRSELEMLRIARSRNGGT